jgi:hypothetical protein
VTSSEDILQTQKNIHSILFRWGQLNGNDFSEPQAYIMRLSEEDKWLQSYLLLFNLETNAHEMLPFIPEGSLDLFVERVAALAQRDDHASTIVEFLRHIQKTKAEKEHAAND